MTTSRATMIVLALAVGGLGWQAHQDHQQMERLTTLVMAPRSALEACQMEQQKAFLTEFPITEQELGEAIALGGGISSEITSKYPCLFPKQAPRSSIVASVDPSVKFTLDNIESDLLRAEWDRMDQRRNEKSEARRKENQQALDSAMKRLSTPVRIP